MMRDKSALRWERIFRMFWPQPHSNAKSRGIAFGTYGVI